MDNIRKIKKLVYLIKKKPRGLYHLLLNTLFYYLKIPQVWGTPTHYTIEPINACDMHCAICETGAGVLKRKKMSLSFNEFKIILDKIKAFANTIHLYFMGEPFLNKDIYRMIQLARKHALFVTTCTNGHFIDAEYLVDSGLNEIHFQVGGLDQKMHERYRANGNLKTTLENITAVRKEREAKKALYPRIVFGFIVMKHNEHQVTDVESFARKVGADKVNIIAPCVRTVEQAKQLVPSNEQYVYYDMDALRKNNILKPKGTFYCPWVFNSLVIMANGDIVPCCRDAQGRYVFGNIFRDSLSTIWKSQQFIEFRKKIALEEHYQTLCTLCSGYGIPELYYSED